MALVIETIVSPPFMENTYLVGDQDSRRALVVDPGGDAEAIARRLEELDLEPEAIVATHGHIDHVSGASDAVRRLRVPFWMHEADRFWVEALPMQAQMFGFPPVQAPRVDRWLGDGDELWLGSCLATVLHTPGHTPGCICLFFEKERALFTGDTLFVGSIGRTDLPGGDPAAIVRSIRERLLRLGDDVAFYPGHGPGGSLGNERRGNPFVGER